MMRGGSGKNRRPRTKKEQAMVISMRAANMRDRKREGGRLSLSVGLGLELGAVSLEAASRTGSTVS